MRKRVSLASYLRDSHCMGHFEGPYMLPSLYVEESVALLFRERPMRDGRKNALNAMIQVRDDEDRRCPEDSGNEDLVL